MSAQRTVAAPHVARGGASLFKHDQSLGAVAARMARASFLRDANRERSMLELYHNNISVCAQKVRLVLAEKNLQWKNHHIDLKRGDHLTPEFLRVNPKGLVPVLVHDGEVVIESSLICEYLDDAFPNPRLKPASPLALARMRLWQKAVDEGLHAACGTISFAAIFARQLRDGLSKQELEERLAKMPDPARRERQRQLLAMGFDAPFVKDAVKLHDKVVGEMDAALQGGPWLMGKEFSLADVVMAPYIERLDRLTLRGFWMPSRPRVGEWLRAIKARPSFVKAFDEFQPHDYNDLLRDQGEDLWPTFRNILAA
jgi:glutathione S-transferase